jgi:helix-turn-helix protein
MKKVGRPPHVKTEENAERVEALCAYGMDHVTIAAMLGISHDTLTKYYRSELDIGKSKVIEKVANSLKQNAMHGDVQAQKFFLSSRAGWSEKQTHEVSGKDGEAVKVEHAFAGQRVKSLLDQITSK